MFKQILELIVEKLNETQKNDSLISNKMVEMVEELNELEVKHAEALASVERWGDITDKSHWRTVEYNKIGRVIEAKKRMIEMLKNK